jgi:hypothetical protein
MQLNGTAADPHPNGPGFRIVAMTKSAEPFMNPIQQWG